MVVSLLSGIYSDFRNRLNPLRRRVRRQLAGTQNQPRRVASDAASANSGETSPGRASRTPAPRRDEAARGIASKENRGGHPAAMLSVPSCRPTRTQSGGSIQRPNRACSTSATPSCRSRSHCGEGTNAARSWEQGKPVIGRINRERVRKLEPVGTRQQHRARAGLAHQPQYVLRQARRHGGIVRPVPPHRSTGQGRGDEQIPRQWRCSSPTRIGVPRPVAPGMQRVVRPAAKIPGCPRPTIMAKVAGVIAGLGRHHGPALAPRCAIFVVVAGVDHPPFGGDIAMAERLPFLPGSPRRAIWAGGGDGGGRTTDSAGRGQASSRGIGMSFPCRGNRSTPAAKAAVVNATPTHEPASAIAGGG